MAGETQQDVRDLILERLTQDILGPGAPDEVIEDRPTDRYLTGILFPVRSEFDVEEDDEAAEADDNQDSGTGLDSIRAGATFRPSSAGLSFAVKPKAQGSAASLTVQVEAGRYQVVEGTEQDEGSADNREPDTNWQRCQRQVSISVPVKETRASKWDLTGYGLSNASLHLRASRWQGVFLVTLAISNDACLKRGAPRSASEEASLFQTSISVRCEEGEFVPKPERDFTEHGDDDLDALALLYRDVRNYAVGHNCSADWVKGQANEIEVVRTNWLPEATIHPISADGDQVFHRFSADGVNSQFCADRLARASRNEIVSTLSEFVEAYTKWIGDNRKSCSGLPPTLAQQGEKHLDTCDDAAARMRLGIDLLNNSDEALDAFRLANLSISLQQSWKLPNRPLVWRPFQIGFALLCLKSLADPEDPDRELMDLLWFPTGGGKTEAYLLLTAFTIFLRRIKAAGTARGAGVAAFMRYTLRLLTIQQFERASALICACELIRRGDIDTGPVELPGHFEGDKEISIGLWVGAAATPNKLDEAIEALGRDEEEATPDQLRGCPCCQQRLQCRPDTSQSRIEIHCVNAECLLSRSRLPVWTVDEDIYHQLPSLIIGTSDKYAQIVRSENAGKLFGARTEHLPPDLIIQDELHLISGPLGSLAGLYEVAIDEMCRDGGASAKVIGSTATIRRAADQVSALFDRDTFQFPPPGLDFKNSGFAVEDRQKAGRQFLAVSTIGRSAKFTLQAVEASLLQTAPNLPKERRDGYWTVVNYFNSLRELGGALVLMRDDVARTMAVLKERRCDDEERYAEEQVELTSRIPSSKIPSALKQLELRFDQENAVDVVLASNMISVGMDVSRLGLMVVNGQPKTIAEYIQASSRVGRSSEAPGLVLTIYNANKARDRSRYETFRSWHQALYREVEATSVTPFAKRARDRALHAPLVAMARHLVPGLQQNPKSIKEHEAEVQDLVDLMVERIEEIEQDHPDEAVGARKELESFVDNWIRNAPETYWNDYGEALLISAETYTERGGRVFMAGQRSTPNSLRSVEASTSYLLERSFAPRRQRNNSEEAGEETNRGRTRRRRRVRGSRSA